MAIFSESIFAAEGIEAIVNYDDQDFITVTDEFGERANVYKAVSTELKNISGRRVEFRMENASVEVCRLSSTRGDVPFNIPEGNRTHPKSARYDITFV